LAAKARRELELTTSPHQVVASACTINELMLAYVEHSTKHYVDRDSNPTNEQMLVKIVSRNTREVYGDLPAAEFGPLALKAVRQKFIDLGWCRKTVNQQVERLRRIFRWAVAEELVPPAVHAALVAVAGLRRGRTEAPDTEPVQPVADAIVGATVPFLGRHVRTMVELQRVTGMRPGEVCRMRLADIDRSVVPWVYKPSRHKTQHLGKSRSVMIGPRGKALIEAFIAGGTVADPSGPLFSPRRMREERFAEMRAKRKTRVQPSQADRRTQNPDPRKLPAAQYTPNAYALAVRRAAKRAGVEHWHPNQLRHTFGTLAREKHGLEAAQHLLGHSRSDVTERYAKTAASVAAAAAAIIG
jgi:integrase